MTMFSDLNSFFEKQKYMMKVLGVEEGIVDPSRQSIVDAIHGIVEEASEVLREYRKGETTLVWRKENIDVEHMFEESVDVFFYLLEFWILLHKTPADVVRMHFEKFNRNLKRVDEKQKEEK